MSCQRITSTEVIFIIGLLLSAYDPGMWIGSQKSNIHAVAAYFLRINRTFYFFKLVVQFAFSNIKTHAGCIELILNIVATIVPAVNYLPFIFNKTQWFSQTLLSNRLH